MFNPNCVADLMRYTDEKITYKKHGQPRFKVHNLRIDGYTTEEIYAAAKYIADCGYVDLDAGIDNKNKQINYKTRAPRHYHIRGITPKGYEFLAVVNAPSIWDKVRNGFAKIAELLALGKTAIEIIQYFESLA